jgi:hypothetical protein
MKRMVSAPATSASPLTTGAAGRPCRLARGRLARGRLARGRLARGRLARGRRTGGRLACGTAGRGGLPRRRGDSRYRSGRRRTVQTGGLRLVIGWERLGGGARSGRLAWTAFPAARGGLAGTVARCGAVGRGGLAGTVARRWAAWGRLAFPGLRVSVRPAGLSAPVRAGRLRIEALGQHLVLGMGP